MLHQQNSAGSTTKVHAHEDEDCASFLQIS